MIDRLAPEVARGTVTQAEVDGLATTHHRRKEQWKHAPVPHGRPAHHSEVALQRAITDLADTLDDADGADDAAVQAARAEVVAARRSG